MFVENDKANIGSILNLKTLLIRDAVKEVRNGLVIFLHFYNRIVKANHGFKGE